MNLDESIDQLERFVAQVRQSSLIDEKTNLGSALALRQEERSVNEGNSPFTVLVFGDLNDFKNLNDEHGHEAGDVAIAEAGKAVAKIVEDLNGKAFRVSGDEFVILIDQPSIDSFLSASESLGSITFLHYAKELKTSMSFGYVLSDGKLSLSELQERAEIACQHAKLEGDGECVQWSETIKSNPLVRKTERCEVCGARTTCNIPQVNAPKKLTCCPSCGSAF